MTLAVGDPAPDFDLPTDGGGQAKLSDYKDRTLVLYFYPKDDTTGCTNEANGFSELAGEFAKGGTTGIGISKDTVKSHDKFKAKYGLDFTLASDVEGKTVEAYGAWVQKKLYGREYMGIDRSTFLIDGEGKIRQLWRKVKVPGHVAAVLAQAQAL